KHVDLCESNPNECVLNNIIKTWELFKSAYYTKTSILFMSTDKAVEPISVYGYTKALGEAMAREYNGAFVRSGNIVESTGSVLTIWDEAIENKRPLRITHKDMKRYFISPQSLVEQVWGRFVIGEKEIIPKMDREISLMDLLKEKLASHNYTIKT